MKTELKGVIHGKRIELEQESGLPDGQSVSVTLETLPQTGATAKADSLESLRRAAGAWSDDPAGLDRFLEWNRQQRKVSRPEIPE
jgi:hypothetical protein